MPLVLRLSTPLAAMLLLLVPALWNRWPLLYFDTGGYLARWYEGTLEIGRSTVYGLFLTAGVPFAFWPVIVLQAAATVWVIVLVLRTHGLGQRPLVLLATAPVLALATALPWLADQLITDIFAGLAVLVLHLLVFRADTLHRVERWALIFLLAFSVASHNATLAVILAVLAAAAVAALFRRDIVAWSAFSRPLIAIGLGAAMLLSANLAVSGRLAWTPGGASLIFGRLVQDGIVKRYLAEHCPDQRLRLCDHQAEIPDNAEMFFWGGGVFDRLGGFPGLATEMETIVRETLVAYPWMQVDTAVRATLQQLVLVRSGDGIISWLPHTYGIIERFTPQLVPAMKAARQQQDEFGFAAINRLHVPVTLGAMLFLPFVIVLTWRRRELADVGLLATSATLAILANAFICGALSNPHDRYGARIAWIAVLVIILVALRLRRFQPTQPP